MRVAQRQTLEHTAIIRALADKTIEAREPGLIKLPLPLPSVPVLTPLLSPLVSGNNNGNNNNNNGKSGTSSSSATTPSSTSSTGGGDTGGSGSGDSGSGGTSSGSTGNGSTSSGTGDSGTGSSGGTTSSGDGTSSGGTSSSTDGSSADSSSSSGSTPSGTTSATGTQASSGGTVLTGVNNNGTTTSDSPGAENGGSSTSAGIQGNGGIGGVANAGHTSSTGSGTTGLGSISSTGASGLPGSSDPNSGTGSSGSGGGALANGNSRGKHGLSAGATAGIIICLLALIFGCVVFFVRRRSRSRRNERVNRWWFSRNRFSQTYGDRNSKEILPDGAQTARSSFATTVDQSYSNHSNPVSSRASQFIIPPLPPMAQIGRANGTAPSMVIDTSYFTSADVNAVSGSRFSIGSANSDSQYLVVNHRDSLNPDLGTPMSVRPFSPSESFAFPKPPDPAGSRPSSSGTFGIQSPTKTLPSSMVIPPPPTPGLPTLISDNNPINNVTDPFQDNNPFDDPSAAIAVNSASIAGFAETEFICRPFHPTLPDELSVRPQDPVRVLQTFDDGWALVEKVRLDDPKGKRKENDGVERGLIPLDCLRAPGQELPDFFAAKRVSSYAGSVAGSGVGFQVL